MRIVSLEPFLTELVCHFGLVDSLVGVSSACDFPENVSALPKVAVGREDAEAGSPLASALSSGWVDLELLRSLAPDLVLGRIPGGDEDGTRQAALREQLRPFLPEGAKYFSYQPRTFDQVLGTFEKVGRDCSAARQGLSLGQRLKAQMMDWADNFYERLKNKRVTFISQIQPLRLGGWWLPDMIQLASGVSQAPAAGQEDPACSWPEIVKFRPDVILIALHGYDLMRCARTFTQFSAVEGWDSIPAVKRGEVYFADGLAHFHRPGPRLIESAGILISAIAGLESGYITPRDSFYRLRWIEMQRHKFQG